MVVGLGLAPLLQALSLLAKAVGQLMSRRECETLISRYRSNGYTPTNKQPTKKAPEGAFRFTTDQQPSGHLSSRLKLKGQLTIFEIDMHHPTMISQLTEENLLSQRTLDLVLNQTRHRTSPHR